MSAKRKFFEVVVFGIVVAKVLWFFVKNKSPNQAKKDITRWTKSVLDMYRNVLGIEYKIKGEPYKDACIIASQHQSAWDSIVFFLLDPDNPPVYVAKHELSKVPVLGRIMQKLGCVFVDRRNPDLDKLIKECKRIKMQGRKIVIFPEGTRKKVDKIKPGVFLLAKRLGVPVQVVRLNSRKCFPTGGLFNTQPGKIQVEFMEVYTPPFTKEKREKIEKKILQD